MRHWIPLLVSFSLSAGWGVLGCVASRADLDSCDKNPIKCVGSGGTKPTSSGPVGGGVGGHGGMGGTGGGAPCGGCKDVAKPFCDMQIKMCVACLADGDCKTADAARCNAGACVKCTASDQCKAHTGTTVCDAGAGKCVECKLGEEAACSGSKTCDLNVHNCVAVAAGSVKNCAACSNDVQCQDGACIALDFNKQPHGYFCLKAANPACPTRPFAVPVNKPSINGVAAKNYCGFDQDQTTCEAISAMLAGWVCSGLDGKCGPQNMPEVPVPGALCKQVGLSPNQCSYSCTSTLQCPSGAPQNTCGPSSPGWCGG